MHHRNHCLWQLKPYEMHFLNNKTWRKITPWSMGCGMDVVLAGMKTKLISMFLSEPLVTRYIIGECNNLKKIFFWTMFLTVGLIYPVNHVLNRCTIIFVLPFIEHKWTWFHIFFKIPRIFQKSKWKMASNWSHQLHYPPKKESTWSLKFWNKILTSPQAVKILDAVFFWLKSGLG